MDILILIKILLEWSITSKEYEMTYFLFLTFNIGIPVKFLYKLPSNNIYFSLDSFITNCDIKYSKDIYLQKLFILFKKSKYQKLHNWNYSYGYKLI